MLGLAGIVANLNTDDPAISGSAGGAQPSLVPRSCGVAGSGLATGPAAGSGGGVGSCEA